VRYKQTISAPEESVLQTICCSNKTVHYKQTVSAPEESVLETIGCSDKTVHDKQTISPAEQTNLCNTNKQTNKFVLQTICSSTDNLLLQSNCELQTINLCAKKMCSTAKNLLLSVELCSKEPNYL
jgi:hypothetical protein